MAPPDYPDLSTLHVSKTRARSSTESLLGKEYPTNSSILLPCPKPLTDASEYTLDRIAESLKYAASVLNFKERKLSPIGQRAVLQYKKACKWLLDEAKQNDKPTDILGKRYLEDATNNCLAIIRGHEREKFFNAVLTFTNTTSAQQLQDQLVALRRMSFLAKYGDLLAEACKKLRSEAQTRKLLHSEYLSGYWTDVAAKLIKEKPAWKEFTLRGKDDMREHCNTWAAVIQGCGCAGFDFENMLKIIFLYAERNEIFHSGLLPLIQQGDYHELSRILATDLIEIPAATIPSEDLEAEFLKQLLNSLIDHWFVRNEHNVDDYKRWGPSKALDKLYLELQKPESESKPTPKGKGKEAASKSKVDIYKDDLAEVMVEVAKKLRNEEQVRAMEELERRVSVEGRKRKRVAASRLQAEDDRTKKWRDHWEKLVKASGTFRKVSDSYKINFGGLDAPPDVVVGDPTSP